jgi:DtxR family transcriptional regulator, Mn-dependent transcriptional regulator
MPPFSGPKNRALAWPMVAYTRRPRISTVLMRAETPSSFDFAHPIGKVTGVVRYAKHHAVRLSISGRRRALEVLRHHRLLERFLHDVLDYSWDEVHEEAERLEHFISERSGAVPRRNEVALSQWVCGIPATISSVSDRDPAALRELQRLGLMPGVKIAVEAGARSAFLIVRIGAGEERVRLNRNLASEILVVHMK